MYLYATPRAYLIAGFTAASIVAAIPLVPKPTVHLPSTLSIETRLASADSQIVNRPGVSGDSTSWEGWSHVRWFVEEVPAGAA
jgi:hypothetical protein